MTLPRTLGALIQRLADEHHDGHPFQIAKRLRVSSALIYQWRDNQTRVPTPAKVQELCDLYGLDYWEVTRMIMTSALPRPGDNGSSRDSRPGGGGGPVPAKKTRPRKPVPIRGGSDAVWPEGAGTMSDNSPPAAAEVLDMRRENAPKRHYVKCLRASPTRWYAAPCRLPRVAAGSCGPSRLLARGYGVAA